MTVDRGRKQRSELQVIGAPPPPPEGRPLSRGGLIAPVAALGLLAAFVLGVLAGQSTERRAESVPPSIPPGRMDLDVALTWEAGPSLAVGHPSWVVEFDENRFLFGAAGEVPGLRAYRSDDGVEWSDLGLVLPEADVSAVAASRDRLVAAGGWHEDPSSAYSTPAVWLSEDGTSWRRSDLPFDTEPGFPAWTEIQSAALADDKAVVFGRVGTDTEGAIRAALPREVIALADQYGMSSYGDPLSVYVYGPFSLPAFTATFEELGLDSEQVAPHREPVPMSLWSSDDLRAWDVSDRSFAPWATVDEVLMGPDGRFIAFGCCGSSLWTSADGLDWQTSTVPGPFLDMAVFEDLMIASRDNGYGPGRLHARYGQPVIMASHNLADWDFITPDDLLVAGGTDWNLESLAAGDYGIAAIAARYPDYAAEEFVAPQNPVVTISHNGITVSHQLNTGMLEVSRGDDSLLRLNSWTDQLDDNVRFDVGNRTVSFLYPASGDVLITLTFDEIEAARRQVEEGYRSGFFQPERTDASIVFSPDGERWSLQSAAEAFGPRRSFGQLFVLEERVLAVVEAEGLPSQLWIGTLP